jgi:APA family basic amino acid/polyamine antiporter
VSSDSEHTTSTRIIKQHRVVERAPLAAVSRLRRALGTAGVYAIGYGNVGSSIYYALGIVAAYAWGATPIALALAGVIFVFTAMTYAEGVSMVPTAGGSVAFARRAFNDLVSFIAGWALALNYIVTTAISAVTAAFYLSYFWAPFKDTLWAAPLGGIVITFLLMLLNIRGVKETARLNIAFAIIDLATQGLLVLLGITLILGGWRNLLNYRFMGEGFWPEPQQLIFGVAIAMVAYVGLESAAQMAEETKVPTRTLPRALFWSVLTVIFMFAALPIVALCAMTPMELVTQWGNDPVAGIASKLPDWHIAHGVAQGHVSVSALMMPWVAILAFTILGIASNAGILAGSRITYNMAHHRQLFRAFSYVHPRFLTPTFAITVISLVAIGIILAGIVTQVVLEGMGRAPGAQYLLLRLGDLYVFSAMMAFAMAHLSVWVLRIKEPDTPRPFWAWPSLRIAGRPISLTATLGFLACLGIWLWMASSPEHAFGRNIGLTWIALGLIFYVWYRRRQGLGLIRPAVTEELSPLVTTSPAPRRREMTRQIRHILIPIHTHEYADQMTRIACDLSTLYTADITAVYAIEVPRSLPVDAELAEQSRRADDVLQAASHIADTLYDKRLETVTLQARSAGVAIVEYAAQRSVDLIVLGALAGRPRTRDASIDGTTADYVARNAHCAVWTTRSTPAPPQPDTNDAATQAPDTPPTREDRPEGRSE